MTPESESVGCEFKYRNFCFWKENPSLISLILNTKSEKKTNNNYGPNQRRIKDFPEGMPVPEMGISTYNFAKKNGRNCMKIKEIGPRGGVHASCPLDQPLIELACLLATLALIIVHLAG